MLKKGVYILLTCLFVLACLPMVSHAAQASQEVVENQCLTEDSLLYIGQTTIINGTFISSDLPDGISFDVSTMTLTLDNYSTDINYQGPFIPNYQTAGILACNIPNLTINLIGENRLDVNTRQYGGAGIIYQNYMNKDADTLVIKGDGNLKIELIGSSFGTGIHVSTGNFIMQSGTLDIWGTKSLTNFTGITKTPFNDYKESDVCFPEFQFLGGTVNIRTPDLRNNNENYTSSSGIYAYDANITVKDATINIDLGKASYITCFATGIMRKSYFYSGIVTIDNSTINCRSEVSRDSKYTSFYKMNDLSGSLYYVGQRAPNKRVAFDDAFEKDEVSGKLFQSTYRYMTITPEPIELEMAFDDVKEGDWYHNSVEYVFQKGIMTGLNDLEFGPAQYLGRGQFATILYRMSDSPKVDYTNRFQDVEDGQFYTSPVLWASSDGLNVVTGYQNGNFGPADNITREQMAVMMYRYAAYKNYSTKEKSNLSGFLDAEKVSLFAKEAMQWAVASGLVSGNLDNTLAPQGTASRAVCATIIQRFQNKFEEK